MGFDHGDHFFLKGLITQMTFEEKVSLLCGSSFWETSGIDRLGIPRMKLTDGPSGARGEDFNSGLSSACFPAGITLAASFSEQLAREVGKALAQETQTKGARVLLAPTVCPHRHPLGGRNLESFGEDPLLAGRLATEYIKGIQGEGIGACIKHFAANEQETNRSSIDARVGERALREIYIKPFEIAIKGSQPWSIMTAYNVVNGTHADSNKTLLNDILRKQWGYDGHVVADWGGMNSLATALNAGVDLEMPGPASWRTVENIQRALDNNEVSMETLETRIFENLKFLQRSGGFDHATIPLERAEDLLEHRALIRRAGAESAVLLKNKNDVLPLNKEKIGSIAMIGLAKQCLSQGGGSAAVNPHHNITPFKAFEEAVDGKIQLSYAEGAPVLRNLPACSKDVVDLDGNPGFSFQDPTGYSRVIVTGIFTPSTSGKHYISLATLGNTKVYINDELVYDIEGKSADVYAILIGVAVEEQKQFDFVANKPYQIRLEASTVEDPDVKESFMSKCLGFNFGFMEQHLMEADLLQEAIDVASSSDVAIVFVGNTPAWETEGADRITMALPRDGSLDRLITAVAATNPHTIVVNSTGSPITMPWLQDVSAVLQAWFPGQEAGYSIADVIFGSACPGGKLPVTFPKALSDAPAFDNFPGNLEANFVEYKEGIYIGYRHYDRKPETILFPFGFGLSYTTFDVSNVSISSTSLEKGLCLTVTAHVTNTGARPGSETVQVYVGPSNEGAIDRPLKELKGFAKVHLCPGAQQSISVSLEAEKFAYFNEERGMWAVDAGEYAIFVGVSSAQIVSTKKVDMSASFEFDA
ncbi:glycoside hydrolase superfamily [Alternaria burnsii]|uniref:beta-glucosidase n=1 Tax=Alternaria burnsii TaxID=1187904 RepID=A0A8H7AUV1_9PLEO|nr:glycoside hydrolase superfamily [Alternaria burnsii]KAF7670956.1 glycoside hydrolase superfamily [Alternaria burnsii]